MNKKLNVPILIMLVGAVAIIISLFLPYVSATEEYAKILNNSLDTSFEQLNMTRQEAINPSLYNIANAYYQASESYTHILYKYFVPISVATIGIFALLNVLFAILKKPIPAIVFDILSVGIFALLNWDFQGRGVFTKVYNFSTGYYLLYVASIVILIGAVWLLINKMKDKKNDKEINKN